MGQMSFLKKKEALLALDIGATSIKFVELSLRNQQPILQRCVVLPIDGDIFTSNIITKGDLIAEKINDALESGRVEEKRIVTSLAGPSIFSKKVRMQRLPISELATNIQFEASNFIPHNINHVKLDFHILGESGRNHYDVLVIAAKDEVLDSYLDAIALSGLQTAVVDVDFFALQNIFEFSYPELVNETNALIHIGNRFSLVNICRGGQSLFSGDIAIGTKSVIEAVEDGLGMKSREASIALKEAMSGAPDVSPQLRDLLSDQASQVAAELSKQLAFFWSASGADDGISRLVLSGGGALLPGLQDALSEVSQLEVELLNPFAQFEISEQVAGEDLEVTRSLMSIAAGLALRQVGDKIIPESAQ